MNSVLSTEGLEVVYPGGICALRPTTMSVEAGEFLVLLGASGAGKSTVLRSLNGLVRPSGGRVVAAGLGDLSSPRQMRLHRRQTAMVFQQHHLIGRLSVLSNVLTGRLAYRSPLRALGPWTRQEKTLALGALERVGLMDQALKRADQLSGGQQQRVGIARALVQHPRILLADEPVASLDPATAEHVLALLHDICKSDGLSAVVSLHQVAFARRFADRIVGLSAGSVVFDRAPVDLSDTDLAALYRTRSAPETAPPARISRQPFRFPVPSQEITQ